MALPRLYFGNLFRLGTISGTNTDEAFPPRRVGDDNATLRWPVISGTTSGLLSGEVQTVLAVADQRTHFVLVSGGNLSGFNLRVLSEDVGGGNQAEHLNHTMADSLPLVSALSGVTTDRRVWRLLVSGTISGLATPYFTEVMLANEFEFPRRPIIGVNRTTVHQVQRIEIPGGAPFTFRLGEELRRVEYQLVAEEDFVLSGISGEPGYQDFLAENDGAQPVWFIDDQSVGYWGEVLGPEHSFDDQAGIYSFSITVQEIPTE